MLKIRLALVLGLLIQQIAAAAPLAARRVEPELGAALGFQVYRFEVELGTDEVLVVREFTEIKGVVTESEYAATGGQMRVDYQIVLVDSGAFHRSLRNTYMLRLPNSDGYIDDVRLTRWSYSPDGTIEFVFCGIEGNDRARTLKWIGSVEKYSEVVKRWPELPKPRANGWSGSRRFIKR